jgi:uncharacterized protein
MKTKLLFILALTILNSCSSHKFNKLPSFVFDNEKILNESQIKELNDLYKNHEKKTSNEIVLVTTENYGEEKNILMFTVQFGNKLQIGKKDKNNGVVIGLSKKQREIRISTGYGTEKILKDEILQKIIDSLMIPRFKEGKYYEGIYSGSKEIVDFLEKPENRIK